jgi:hypothetical protein
VEVTIIDEAPHAGKKRRDLEKGLPMGVGVMGFHLWKRRIAGATSARDADDKMMRPTTADTLVAHDEREDPEEAGVAIESGPGLAIGDTADTTTSGPALETQEHKIRSSSLSHLPPQNQEARSRRIYQTDTTVDLNSDTDYPVQVHLYDDYDFDNDNNNVDNEILEIPRGREGYLGMSTNELSHAFRRTMSGSSLVSGPVLGMGRMAEISRGQSSTPPPSTISHRSSILPHIFPSQNIPPLSYSPHSQPGSRSRPRTAPPTAFMATTIISPSPLASAPTSRPGTSDSAGPGSIRYHRLDSIRGATTIPQGHIQGHRTPPTRDSSPSRSVRFVDYVDGESGHVGPFGSTSGNGNDNQGRKTPIVDIPPPMPSRSSSFYRDGNGRSLVGSPVEGEGPGVSASGSVTTTD